jgi:hypothetical protein
MHRLVRLQPLASASTYRTSPPVWRSTDRSIGSQRSQRIGQISGARCLDVGKDRDATPVAGVHVSVVLHHQQIDHLSSVRQCAMQMVQRRPAVLIACVRQAWFVRQQRAKPVGSIAAAKEPIAAQVCVCFVDTRDGCDADQGISRDVSHVFITVGVDESGNFESWSAKYEKSFFWRFSMRQLVVHERVIGPALSNPSGHPDRAVRRRRPS